jgi:parvulin-like peptidyl-prolyl isomerase
MITVFRWALPWASTDKATPAAVAVSEVDLVAKTAKEIQPKVEAIVKDIVAAAQEDAKEDRAELARKMQALADEIKAYGTETP